MSKQSLLLQWAIRGAMVLFWLTLFYLFLLLPYFSSFLPEQRSICVYTWSDRIDEEIIQKFEEKTGIRVYVNYYDSNEELITKLEVMPYVDCDLIFPSGYMVEHLITSNLLKKIDHSRCNFIEDLYPEFMGKFYDSQNEYSLPIYWDVMTLGYSEKTFFDGLPSNSWAMIFEQDQVPCKKIGMIDDAREILSIQSKYLGLKKKDINKYVIRKMKDMLIAQKKWIGVYCDAQQGYFLLSGAYSLVVSYREYIVREMQDYDFIKCMVPKEGSLLAIDNVVISAATKKEDLVYQFLNYLYSEDVYLQNAECYSILPASKKVFKKLDQKYIGIKGLRPEILRKKNIRVFKNLLTLKQTNKFWIRVKSA